MDDIFDDNCHNMCIERGCNNKHTQFTMVTMNKMKLFLAFCDDHADEFVKNDRARRMEE